jgi:hypothetical protein
MKLLIAPVPLLLLLLALTEARPRRSFFVPDLATNGCGYASCPAYNASAKVTFKLYFMYIGVYEVVHVCI